MIVTKPFFRDAAHSSLIDIEGWLTASRERESTGDPWIYLWGALHMGNDVIGVAEFSVHIDYPWAFGGYFGVRKGWRNQDRSEKFLRDVVDHLQTVMPIYKGIIFEIEHIEFDYLKKISAEQNPITFDEKVLSNLRAIRRLLLFQNHYAYPVLGSNGLPLPYREPAMENKLSETNEREFILMVYPVRDVPKSDINLQEIVDFVYDKVYIDSYGAETGPGYIPGYRSYVAEEKRRVEESMRAGWMIKAFPRPPKEIMDLYTLARRQGLYDQLDL
jgi:hypothetical protein